MSIDDFLFSSAAQRLGIGNLRAWLDTFPKRVNAHTLHRLDLLINRLGEMKHQGVSQVIDGLKRLRQEVVNSGESTCVLCLGWGGGWDSKTFGSRLQKDAAFFERHVIERFSLHRGKAPRKPGDPFPRTRRVIVREKQEDLTVTGLTGWCALEMKLR